jgi:hypothetical protein
MMVQDGGYVPFFFILELLDVAVFVAHPRDHGGGSGTNIPRQIDLYIDLYIILDGIVFS